MRDVILSSSVLIIAILAIRTLAKGKISAKLQYALWLLVMVRLIVPGTIGSSPISVQRLTQFPAGGAGEADTEDVAAADIGPWTIGSIVSDMDAGISAYLDGNAGTDTDKSTGMNANGNILGNTNAGAETNGGITDGADVFGSAFDDRNRTSRDEQAVNASANTGTNLLSALPRRNAIYGIWIIGIMIMGGYMLLYQIRFSKYLEARRKPLHGKYGQYHGLKVYTVKGLPSPCLCGKCIYLDGEMAEDDRRLNHVLAHEYCHYRQLDTVWAHVRCILVSVYWFHPLVWAAAYASKQDSEFACDEAAIRLLGEAQRYEYGRTLLGLVSLKTSKMQDIGAALTMGSSEKGMRERISRIAKRRKPLMIAGSLVLVAVALFAVVTFTGTRQKTGLMMLDSETGTTLVEADITDKISDSEAPDEEKDRILEELKRKQAEAVKQHKAEEEAKEVEQQEEELRRKMEELAAQEAQAMQESASVIALLYPYDEMLLPVKGEGREGEIRELPAVIIRRPSELWAEYLSQGEDAIIEGLYLLASWNGREGQSMPQSVSDEVEDIISVYGMYTKEYGLRGVKIVVGEGTDKDVNNFDIPWSFLGASRVHVFETYPGDETSDGLPRTFAFKQLIPGSEGSYMNYGAEAHELYLCDRYDTGHIEVSKVSEGEFALQIRNRISCRMNREEQKIYVYDNGTPVGVIDASEFSETDLGLVKAVVNTDYIDFVLGSNTGNIWINVPVALQTESDSKERQTWFPLYSFIDFPIDCGYFGPDREFTLGKAALDTAHVAGIRYVEPNGDL